MASKENPKGLVESVKVVSSARGIETVVHVRTYEACLDNVMSDPQLLGGPSTDVFTHQLMFSQQDLLHFFKGHLIMIPVQLLPRNFILLKRDLDNIYTKYLHLI